MAPPKSKSMFRRGWDYTWRGPSTRWLALVALGVILGLVALAAAAVLGFNRGLADARADTTALVEQAVVRGQSYMNAGQDAQAMAEFERALELDPGNPQAADSLLALQNKPTSAPSPAALPQAETPGAMPETTPDTAALAADLFQQAEKAIAGKQWPRAANALEQLAALDPTYQADEARTMWFDAAYQQGLALVEDERYEEALRFFDQALVIEPDSADARSERDLVALYADALGMWRLDWEGVVQILERIQRRRPGFLDVEGRLAAAYEGWGDSLQNNGRWCDAARQYATALERGASTRVETKQDQSKAFCLVPPTPTPGTPEPGDTLAIAGSVQGSGRLAFATQASDSQRWTIYLLSLGSGRTPQAQLQDASQPTWSPDGNNLVARSERGDQTGLVGLSVNGSNRWRLTSFQEDSHPSWSPDGSTIAFESNREGDRRWRIYRVNSNGGDESFLAYGRWPSWLPQGQTIVYQGCDEGGGTCGLLTISRDGSNLRPLTNVPGDTMPAWSPDGTRLAFASAERGGSWDIFMLDTKSGSISSLSNSPGVDAHPTWSSDGRQVAFLSNRDGVWAIYVIDVASGQTQRAAALPGMVPDWYEAQLSWGR